MSQSQHNRSNSHGRKLPDHARPTRPPPLTRRGHSYNRAHGHSHSRTEKHPAPKQQNGPGWSKRHAGPSVVRQEFEDDDFTDFLQYCANCEKQITNPLSTGLYCSEACRKTDEAKPTPLVTPLSTVSCPTNPFESTPTSNIIQPLSPTVLRPRSTDFSDYWFADSSDDFSLDGRDSSEGSNDDDDDDDDSDFDRRRDSGSAAADYLSQFHHLYVNDEPTNTRDTTHHHHLHHHSDDGHSSGWRQPQPPRFRRALTTTTSSSTLPSLSTTPSSVSTAASYSGFGRTLMPQRSTPWSATSHIKSVDLVTPLPISAINPATTSKMRQEDQQLDISCSMKSSASTMTCFQVAEADKPSASPAPSSSSYDKRKVNGVREMEKRRGSLKQLFSHDAMRGTPLS